MRGFILYFTECSDDVKNKRRRGKYDHDENEIMARQIRKANGEGSSRDMLNVPAPAPAPAPTPAPVSAPIPVPSPAPAQIPFSQLSIVNQFMSLEQRLKYVEDLLRRPM
jgi:hypothetical protein